MSSFLRRRFESHFDEWISGVKKGESGQRRRFGGGQRENQRLRDPKEKHWLSGKEIETQECKELRVPAQHLKGSRDKRV